MTIKLRQLFEQLANPPRGIIGSIVVEEHKHAEQDETVLELLREQRLDKQLKDKQVS